MKFERKRLNREWTRMDAKEREGTRRNAKEREWDEYEESER
jgi:hypothetical protein